MSKTYEIGSDNLVIDGQNIDVKNIEITVGAGAGKVSRGQIIDRKESDGTYVPHATSGDANVIVAQDVEYAEGANKVVAPCYVTGGFRVDAVIATPELTAEDKEVLRNGGIILG